MKVPQVMLAIHIASFVMSPLTNTQVLNHFLTLDKSKVSLDIPNTMLQMIAPIISPVFTNIYNESLN